MKNDKDILKENLVLRSRVKELEYLLKKYERSKEKLEYLSFHDKLTGLYNRSYFEEELNRLDNDRNLPISIIVGDVDGLKIINDAFGHDKGDNLLKKISSVLKSSFRDGDIIARWGGDEFITILPKTANSVAKSIIDRINSSCKDEKVDHLPLSISLGSSTKIKTSKDIQQVIKEAEDIMYKHKMTEHHSIRSFMIAKLEKAIATQDNTHSDSVRKLSSLATSFGKALDLTSKERKELKLLAAVHDIGKVAIANGILPKPKELTRKEWELVKKHTEIGFRIAETSPVLAPISEDILYHHERWDGKGYPSKLKGNKIPLLARVVAIIDAYEAMTSGRPYKEALSKKQAIEEIKMQAGKQFDPELVDDFINYISSNDH